MATFFDYILGQGKYGDDQPANPATGYTPGDQRSAFFTSLANTVGALVEAQNLSGADRANMMASIPARLQSGQEGLRLMTEQRRADTSRSEMDAFADTLSPEQRMLFKIDPAGYAKMRMTPPPALSGSPGSYAAYVKDQDSRGLPAMSYVEFVTTQKKAGATSVNVATSRENSRLALVNKHYGDQINIGPQANATLNTVNELAGEMKRLGTDAGFLQRVTLSKAPLALSGFGAYQAIVNRLAPSMKAGPGATSDRDIQFMLDSLPKMSYSRETIDIIISSLRKKAQMQVDLADNAMRYAQSELSPGEAYNREKAIYAAGKLSDAERAAFGDRDAGVAAALERN